MLFAMRLIMPMDGTMRFIANMMAAMSRPIASLTMLLITRPTLRAVEICFAISSFPSEYLQ